MWLTELKTRYMQGHQATPGGAAASLVILFILLIAVLHGDALEPPALADRRRGLLHRQPVPDGLVGFAVQGGVQHALQSEISVGFLKQRWAKGQGQHQLPCFAAGTNLCPCAGGLGPLMGEVGIPGESQPWGHFALPGKWRAQRSISAVHPTLAWQRCL